MLVFGTQPVTADSQYALAEVHVFPFESQRFALAQSQRECDDPADPVAALQALLKMRQGNLQVTHQST